MAIFEVHNPLVFTFGVLGNIVSIFVFFVPLPTFIQICRRKSTLGFQSLPSVVALFSAMLWLYYAFLKTDAVLLISVNLFGCIIETIYIIVYLVYAPPEARNNTLKLLACLNVGLFSFVVLFSLILGEAFARIQAVGWVCVVVSVCVFAAPLSIVFRVIRTKSVEFMPFTLSFFLTLAAVMWFAYGLLQNDLCVTVPNVFGFFLGLLQMLVFGMYRKSKKAMLMERKLPEQIINMVMLGTSEVHPAAAKSGATEDEKRNEEIDDDRHGRRLEEASHVNVQLDSPVLVVSTV